MAAVIEIDGVEIVPEKYSILVQETIEERSTAEFTVVDSLGTASYVRGTPLTIDDIDGNRIFSGFIDTPSKKAMAPAGGLYHGITCIDNHYLADKRIVARIWTSVTCGSIVQDLITDYLAAEGVGVGDIQAGPIVEQVTANYVNCTDVLEALAERAGFIWYIDVSKDLYFIDRATYAAPWVLTSPDIIKETAEEFGGNPEYRNRQWVRGGLVPTSSQTEEFSADGEQVSFALGFPLYSVPTITEDAGPALTMGIKGVDTGKDYYWNKGDNVVYADSVPGAGVIVKAVYVGMFPAISQAEDVGGIAARAAIEGGTGYVDASLYDSNIESKGASQELASSKLVEYSREATQFHFSTYRSGLGVGQLLDIIYAPFGYNHSEMLITSITVTFSGKLALYEVVAITGPVLGSWAKLFKNLITQATNVIGLGGDAQINILLQRQESLEVFESTVMYQDEFAVSGQVGRWIALPPAQGVGHHVEHERVTVSEDEFIITHTTSQYCWY